MPKYTVVGQLTHDEMELIILDVYRGNRPGRVPVGGWGHVLDAPDRRAARRRALATFQAYTDGTLVYEVQFTVEAKRKGWIPWRRKGKATESYGSLPIV